MVLFVVRGGLRMEVVAVGAGKRTEGRRKDRTKRLEKKADRLTIKGKRLKGIICAAFLTCL